MIQRCIEREKNKRAQFYTAYSIKEELESRDRVKDKHARIYRKRADTPLIKDRTFPFVRALVSQVIKAETQPVIKVIGQPEVKADVQVGFNPTSFLSFTA